MNRKFNNNWNEGNPTEDGVYLTAFDEWDEDEKPWVCYDGVWKKIGELPK